MLVEWLVTAAETGQKLVFFLTQRLAPQYSARFLKRLIDHGLCQINGHVERFASTGVSQGDHIVLEIVERESTPSHQLDKKRLLYEDEALFVYDKPVGLTSDEKGIIQLLKPYFSSLQLVHRLDRETTGVLLFAKDKKVLQLLIEQFRAFKIQKRYLAIVDGILDKPSGLIENYLGKKHMYAGQTIWGAVKPSQGQYACTKWQRLKKGVQASLVACFPKTGRTHQIRVHLAGIAHPILGDFQYGRHFQCLYRPPRYLLHAENLRLIHPLTQQPLSFTAPLPPDFKSAQHKLFKE